MKINQINLQKSNHKKTNEVNYNHVTITVYSAYVKTSDCWYPNFPDNKVFVRAFYYNPKVNICKLPNHQFMTRICIWGADDFGMEKDEIHDLDNLKEVKAKLFLEAQSLPTPISIKYLESVGFIRA